MSDSSTMFLKRLERAEAGVHQYALVFEIDGAEWHAHAVLDPDGWRMVPDEDLALAVDLLKTDDTPAEEVSREQHRLLLAASMSEVCFRKLADAGVFDGCTPAD